MVGGLSMLMLGFSCVEIGGGKAGIEAAGGDAKHYGGENDNTKSSHNAHYLTRRWPIDKRLD
jgi:hypothetical protein